MTTTTTPTGQPPAEAGSDEGLTIREYLADYLRASGWRIVREERHPSGVPLLMIKRQDAPGTAEGAMSSPSASHGTIPA